MPSCVIPRETLTPVFGDVGELDRVVRVRPDRVGEVVADLALDDVERRDELDVADVVAAEVDVHEAGDELVVVGVLVVLAPWSSELAQLPTPMIATRTLSSPAPAPVRRCRSVRLTVMPPSSCLRTCRTRWTTVIHAVAARRTIAQGSTPHGASTSPAVMTTTRSAREPMPTSPRRPSASALRAGVGDEERAGDRGDRDGDEDVVVLPREDERDRGEHEALARRGRSSSRGRRRTASTCRRRGRARRRGCRGSSRRRRRPRASQ